MIQKLYKNSPRYCSLGFPSKTGIQSSLMAGLLGNHVINITYQNGLTQEIALL